ncbi:MAG TPA: retropepsin-like aspartic protease [Sedimentisphaerales bacterium]|nr:retropepsin-like aspartic protease [Sedimentisphaerales bacterium]
MTNRVQVRLYTAFISLLLMVLTAPLPAVSADWSRQDVDWQAGGGRRIKGIHHPKDHAIQTLDQRDALPTPSAKGKLAIAAAEDELLVESPPVDGFVPWITVSITRQRGADLEMEAIVETSVRGSYPTGVNPQRDYIIGLFDTGASAHVIGYADATRAGVYKGLVTTNMATVSGVTGSVDVMISYPLAVFIGGLDAVAPAALTLDQSAMMGQSNVAVVVGRNPGTGPDLPTAIGSPMSVYYTTLIRNDRKVTLTRDGRTYTAPEIRMYDTSGADTPRFANAIPLELRPLGGFSVQYIPTLDLGGGGSDLDDILGGWGGGTGMDFPPAGPSTIIGNSSQSLFFIHSVDLYDGTKSALDKNRFMLDTGAQVTVVGSRMAARLQLDPAAPEFEVEIQGVTGDVIMAPGFYIDTLEIPALGQWFRATNVPVVLLDIASPEGGTLDGIIGMNLFVDFNLILRGGGLFLEDDPRLELQRVEATTNTTP